MKYDITKATGKEWSFKDSVHIPKENKTEEALFIEQQDRLLRNSEATSYL